MTILMTTTTATTLRMRRRLEGEASTWRRPSTTTISAAGSGTPRVATTTRTIQRMPRVPATTVRRATDLRLAAPASTLLRGGPPTEMAAGADDRRRREAAAAGWSADPTRMRAGRSQALAATAIGMTWAARATGTDLGMLLKAVGGASIRRCHETTATGRLLAINVIRTVAEARLPTALPMPVEDLAAAMVRGRTLAGTTSLVGWKD
mmetsp:Transcript_19247/g.72695  ORF Transcript_19247/g.72695 Transcript_19247/m.72695 type:complete len:207 (+) Transcript_19247:629-1249(+)